MICRNIERASSNHVQIEKANFLIEEKDEAGAGSVHFINKYEALVWRGGRTSPISWLNERKCADGIVLVDQPGEIVLYLVELKNSVGTSELTKIQSQFLGAFHNYIAIAAVVEAVNPARIELIVALKRDKIAELAASSPSIAKIIPGDPASLSIALWLQGEMSINGLGRLLVKKVWRDAANGHGAFNM